MTLELEKYLKKHSSTTIRNRADSIYLDLESNTESSYLFSYLGSERKRYAIQVLFKKNKISSTCSCPYDYGGLCKHEVAALNYIINQKTMEIKQRDLFGHVIKDIKHDEIYLDNHQLSDLIIESLRKKNNIHYLQKYYVQLLEVNVGMVKTIYDNWHIANQRITYDPSTNILKVECSCKDSKKKQCIHILSALDKIVDDFGKDFFNPNYIENQKADFLKKYDLSLADDYQKFFNFSFGIHGLQIVEKTKNLVPSLKLAVDSLLPQLNQNTNDAFLIPIQRNSIELAYGIGFCFDLYKNGKIDYFKFYPFKAKYKKHSTEFASSFSEIDPYYLINQFKNIQDSDKMLLIKTLGFSEVYKTFLKQSSVEAFRDAFVEFNDLINNTSEYPFFIKKESDTLVKKNLIPVDFSNEKAILSFKFTENEDLFTLKPKITIEDKTYQINSSKIKIFPFFCLCNNTIYRFKTPY